MYLRTCGPPRCSLSPLISIDQTKKKTKKANEKAKPAAMASPHSAPLASQLAATPAARPASSRKPMLGRLFGKKKVCIL
jgi:hypothetical protein